MKKWNNLSNPLKKQSFMGSKLELVKYQGFWYTSLKSILHYQKHFVSRDSDIFISSLPKTGITWMKSLLFSIVNRADHQPLKKKSPLLTHNPHELVYYLELGVYRQTPENYPIVPRPNQLQECPSPRLLQTHSPYASLPESVKVSSCKILYIARNPLDTIVSYWHFFVNFIKRATPNQDFQPPPMEDFLEDFCQGRFLYGPYFEHVAGYWKESLKQPNKVLFLKYEDLKDNPTSHLKRMAEFIGLPFSPQEVSDSVIDDIIELCSIKSLKEMEVNKAGLTHKFIDNKDYFRKGEVGDWINHLTPPMVDKIQNLMEEKFKATGLFFDFLPRS